MDGLVDGWIGGWMNGWPHQGYARLKVQTPALRKEEPNHQKKNNSFPSCAIGGQGAEHLNELLQDVVATGRARALAHLPLKLQRQRIARGVGDAGILQGLLHPAAALGALGQVPDTASDAAIVTSKWTELEETWG